MRFGLPQIVATAALSSDRSVVMLENDTLIFDAGASPPQSAVLDSPRLTMYLLAVIAALLIVMAIAYAAGRRRSRLETPENA